MVVITEKIKLISYILISVLFLIIMYKKIILNYNHFEEFESFLDEQLENDCKYINMKNTVKDSYNVKLYKQQMNDVSNLKLYNQQKNNTLNLSLYNQSIPCLPFYIKKQNIDKLYRKSDPTHKYLGNRCVNTYTISKSLMKNYKNVKKMFINDYPLFDKV